jgi:hypothetical protein
MEIKPKGNWNIKLKTHKEIYSYMRCTTSMKNIIIGTPYIDNFGDINIKNEKT